MNYYEILEKLESNEFGAYIVGGYVRDMYLHRECVDADIITNALPIDILRIFDKNVIKVYEKYGAVKLKFGSDIIDITTYRKELSYLNGKPSKIEFISNIEEDLLRRDFTINTLCMDKDGNIIDFLNIIDDFKLKIIKTIRNTNQVLKEDSSRIIRAIRLSSELDFSLDKEIHEYIIKNKNEISKIPFSNRKKELDKLFSSGKSYKFFQYIKKYGLEEYLGIRVNDYIEVKSNVGVWAQLEVEECYNFSKEEKRQIDNIKYLINKGFIDKYDIYKLGLDISLIGADILGIKREEVNLLYTNLKIKGIIDICISGEEIASILNIKPGKLVGTYLRKLESEIIDGTLENDYQKIVDKLKEWGDIDG